MTAYPVHYSISPPPRFSRLQLAIRFVAFLAIGVLGISFGSVFVFAYLALPVFAASRLAAGVPPSVYVAEDGRRVVRALRWLAAVSAWAGLIAERLPSRAPEETVTIEITPPEASAPATTAGAAMARLLTGLPSAFVLAILCWVGMFVWLWAALSILFTQRVGSGAFQYLVGVQRWSIRLLAYQASLVEEYPPFSFDDAPPPALPSSHATA
jgi:hypothetical protein